ncbi:Transmembrane 9 superfamily member 1 [Castilleja foliolosa]|uniref:Transmembrane 9 superfamily member n=1 Tax=Castilleja foliolosa TaxID=1961234 RepID=A0ABD3BML2_9LAMI
MAPASTPANHKHSGDIPNSHFNQTVYLSDWWLVKTGDDSQGRRLAVAGFASRDVGQYNNPQETYNYYTLPFCRPPGNLAHKWGGLGEVLGGNKLIDSQIEIKFKRNVEKTKICEIEIDAAKSKQFKEAIDNSYWFEFFMIILTPKTLEEGRALEMTYSVKWVPTNITFARRFDVYLDYPFFEHQIHWFSVFNSFMMVIFLTGLVSMILMRTRRNDYAKYAREDDDLETLERDVSEESGWKLVHGAVFRPPQNLALLSAVVGTGAQLATLVLLVIILAIVGMLYIGHREELLTLPSSHATLLLHLLLVMSAVACILAMVVLNMEKPYSSEDIDDVRRRWAECFLEVM